MAELVAYLDVGYATPDNNLAENAIRPFVVDRKNWMFAGTLEGAAGRAAIYSLIETAKVNGLGPTNTCGICLRTCRLQNQRRIIENCFRSG